LKNRAVRDAKTSKIPTCLGAFGFIGLRICKMNTEERTEENVELAQLFEQVWVINLKRRPERLKRFWSELRSARWPFKIPDVFSAIEGDKVGVPNHWQTGGGSYGCLRSHQSILERAIQDDIQSLLVLEDDATFSSSFVTEVTSFLKKVPADWQCLMLGGQHVDSKPAPLCDGVVKPGGGGGIQRTHCYALRGTEVMKALYKVWANASVHCDWIMGPCMSNFQTYAPEPFLVGQAEGPSDISGQRNPTKFWRAPSGDEPVIILRVSRGVMEALKSHGWHSGHTRDPLTGIDVGLRDIYQTPNLTEADRLRRLKAWIDMIQWEVVSMKDKGYCTMWHEQIDCAEIVKIVRGNVIEISATSIEEALAKLPHNFDVPKKESIRVALLRAPKKVMDELRANGWHNGYWRDTITGQDNGFRQLVANRIEDSLLATGLQELVKTLHDEVRFIPGGIATIWDEKVEGRLVESKEIEVIEIFADSAQAARRVWHERTNGK